jgi:hypothetical protein
MDSYFREAMEGLKQAADGVIMAAEGIKKTTGAVLTAKDEHEDLRETVMRLEGTVLDLVKEVRALREGKG